MSRIIFVKNKKNLFIRLYYIIYRNNVKKEKVNCKERKMKWQESSKTSFPYRGKGKEQASLPSLFAYLVATFAA